MLHGTVLGPVGVQVCHYLPPSDKELAAMEVK